MPTPFVTRVPFPADRLVAKAFDRVDYEDTYRVPLPRRVDVTDFGRAFFGSPPLPARVAMKLRDVAVRPFGLQPVLETVGPLTFEVGRKSGIMQVFARTPDELLLGLDDRHLDMRLSLAVQAEGADVFGVASTIVRFNGWLGRAYFAPVRPFHAVVVKRMLRQAARALSSAALSAS